jgi:acetylornithine deacetylase
VTAGDAARDLVRPLEDDLVRLLQDLVRTETIAIPPDGHENRGQHVLRMFLLAHGLTPEVYDVGFLEESTHPGIRRDRHYRGRQNLQVTIAGSGRGRSLLCNGHMDTVPFGPGTWSDEPLSGTIAGGRCYGRGAFDMKGGLVAQFGAACALARGAPRLGGDFAAESVVDEEWGGGGGTLAACAKRGRFDAAVVTEGTELAIARATRGGYVVNITCRAGQPDAYFTSQELVSPAIATGRLLGWIDELSSVRRSHTLGRGAYASFADPAPVQVLAVEAGHTAPEAPYCVPLSATVRLYLQFLPEEDVQSEIAAVRESFASFCTNDPFFREHPPLWSPVFDPPLLGHELRVDHPWTACLASSAHEVLGNPPTITAAPYPCDAFLLDQELGIPTLLFGPSGGGAHNPNEYVDIESVIDATRTLVAAALDWCRG